MIDPEQTRLKQLVIDAYAQLTEAERKERVNSLRDKINSGDPGKERYFDFIEPLRVLCEKGYFLYNRENSAEHTMELVIKYL